MKRTSYNIGIGFGLASGVITTLGLMIGIFASTHSKGHVIGGILTIAIADAFSDAFGIHLSEETAGVKSNKEIWISTIVTFISKFFVALTFVFAIIFTPLTVGIIINIAWSFLLVGLFTYYISKKRKDSPYMAIFEHFSIMIVVILATFYTGKAIDYFFIPG